MPSLSAWISCGAMNDDASINPRLSAITLCGAAPMGTNVSSRSGLSPRSLSRVTQHAVLQRAQPGDTDLLIFQLRDGFDIGRRKKTPEKRVDGARGEHRVRAADGGRNSCGAGEESQRNLPRDHRRRQNAAALDKNQLDVETLLAKKTASLDDVDDAQRRHRRCITDDQLLQFGSFGRPHRSGVK